MFNPRALVALISLTFFNTLAFADFNTPGFELSAYAGATFTDADPGDLHLQGETDSLHPDSDNQTSFAWGLGAAYRFMPPSFINKNDILHDISLGLDFFYFQTTQDGDAWQFEQPIFNNFTYEIPIKSYRLLVDNEWTFRAIQSYFFPFVEVGIGFACNKASYEDMPNPGYAATGTHINSHVKYQFAYTAGGGIKVPFSNHFNFSLRYLYANMGNAKTADSANIPLNEPLTISLSTQAVFAGLTYLL